MKYKRIVSALVMCCFLSTMILTVPVVATNEQKTEREYTYLSNETCDSVQVKPDKPGKPSPKPTATVDIRNIPSGDTLYGTVLIIAQVKGTFTSAVFQVDNGAESAMVRVDSTDRYEASWTTSGTGQHTLSVKAQDSTGNDVATSSVSVTVVSAPLYEVRYEIDYIEGHQPDPGMLDYLKNYWLGHGIDVEFTINQQVSDPTPDGIISDNDFWTLENEYNGGPDNSATYGYQFTLQDKWMLYGTKYTVSNVGGYTYVGQLRRDCVGGNYIFIADGMIDQWETQNGIPSNGGEVIVTGHEAGHSICILVGTRSEKYDTDYYSMMSLMRLENAKAMENYWYYSKEYWSTANLSYYD